ncbi:MAG: glutamine--tRNA ligase/YqeY domain fusion protein [Verrucomicrobiaceae bacterium]|nr:glutamine--tRNA ligase/YqeY domain fusion protein [Verrucomicrobiaceae bacterium]
MAKQQESASQKDFIREIVSSDLHSGKHKTTVTRFPPEPNGYLHIGHAKSICLNFGIAQENASTGARCHLRFDDTNPAKEETEYVDAIKNDIRWLGYDWGEHLYFASDYFDQLYEWAVSLIKEGKAYVDDLSAEEIREYRGTLTEAGKESPSRDRDPELSLSLFTQMKDGDFGDGEKVLRARIDMGHANLNMRDPVLYRILHKEHHRTGSKWCIYPTYDYAHGQSDAIEGVTHSLCTLEFEHHRPLYEWLVENLPVPSRPRQIEFAKLRPSYFLMSKRRLVQMVEGGHVDGWDDPRMSTLSGLRRRGYPAAAIRSLCRTVGVTKYKSVTDVALLDHAVREELNKTAMRRMAVIDPVRVSITNWPEGGHVELMNAVNNPEDPDAGTREVALSGEVFIERSDFMDDPPKKYYRLSPGAEVRLRYSYCIRCEEVIRDKDDAIIEIKCTYDPETLGKNPEGRKVRGAIHWVSATDGFEADVRLYDRSFMVEDPVAEDDWREVINAHALIEVSGSKMEPSLQGANPGECFQFERNGYFCVDSKYSIPGKPVFNRTVPLRDSWGKKRSK